MQTAVHLAVRPCAHSEEPISKDKKNIGGHLYILPGAKEAPSNALKNPNMLTLVHLAVRDEAHSRFESGRKGMLEFRPGTEPRGALG